MVEAVPDIQATIDRARELMAAQPPAPIFEATFQREDVLVRVDILQPDGQCGWIAVEVEATSQVRDYHLADLAPQIWVMRGCRVRISSAFIRHVAGRINWAKLDASVARFRDTDVTQMIEPTIDGRQPIVELAASNSAERTTDYSHRHPLLSAIFACEFTRFYGSQEGCTKYSG